MKSDRARKEDGIREIWELREKGQKNTSDIREYLESTGDANLLSELVREEYVMLRGNQLSFTKEGAKKAQEILRNNRLLKKFFEDILQVESPAEIISEFEHYLSQEVADKLCTFLGHPKDDRGLDIPEGKCCSITVLQEEGLMSLSNCGIGEEVV
ncbi:MAG: iron dependent repressor, metal binding and dimerization domain protein, partial [bacterium]